MLGNDLAGERVKVQKPLLGKYPQSDFKTDMLENDFPGIFPACVTTRAMSRKPQVNTEYDLSQIFMNWEGLSEENGDHESIAMSEETRRMTRSSMIEAQKTDPEVSALRTRMLTLKEANQHPVCFYEKNGLLMRKWRPRDVPEDAEWHTVHQIVIPTVFRECILSLAHESPMAGHGGVTKTLTKLSRHFFWPGMRKSVKNYCQSCHVCQIVGKPNQKPAKAHPKPIPAFGEPFARIVMDCVGPLPKTKSGKEYLLTIMCASTRYVDAIALRNIKTQSIIEALQRFFTIFGFPIELQSDRGVNFCSNLFSQTMAKLGVHHVKSSVYHPQTQGALERFHQTLKLMLRTYCSQHERDWDEGVQLGMFAARENVNESLGFSSNELVFGHNVRGPLKVVKEGFMGDPETPSEGESLLKYVHTFRTRLYEACVMAKAHFSSSQGDIKARYDKDARHRVFAPGDQVLMFLPVPGLPLKARFMGPYEVESCVRSRESRSRAGW